MELPKLPDKEENSKLQPSPSPLHVGLPSHSLPPTPLLPSIIEPFPPSEELAFPTYFIKINVFHYVSTSEAFRSVITRKRKERERDKKRQEGREGKKRENTARLLFRCSLWMMLLDA